MDIETNELIEKIVNNPGRAFSIKDGSELKEEGTTETQVIPDQKPFTITSTIKLTATDARAAILKASQLLALLANGTPYEFEVLNVRVE